MTESKLLLGLLMTTALCAGCLPEHEPDPEGSSGMGGSGAGTGGGTMAGIGSSSAGNGGTSGEQGEPPDVRQAALWLGLSSASGTSCPANRTYQLPDDARATITSTSAEGELIKDGVAENLVECTVRLATGSTTEYTVSLQLSSGEVNRFSANGTLSEATGELAVSFNTAQRDLQQAGCVATVKTVRPGALWLSALRCENLLDPSSPGVQCDGQGGLIFENCDR